VSAKAALLYSSGPNKATELAQKTGGESPVSITDLGYCPDSSGADTSTPAVVEADATCADTKDETPQESTSKKNQSKKDYWKARLAAKKKDGIAATRPRRSRRGSLSSTSSKSTTAIVGVNSFIC
jgi:hypothetical protein